MKKYLFAILVLGSACGSEEAPRLTSWNCTYVAVCDGDSDTDRDSVCGDQDDIEMYTSTLVAECESALVDLGCSSYSCDIECADTKDSCE